MFSFKLPLYLILIPIVTYLFFKKRKVDSIKVPSVEHMKKFHRGSKKHLIGKILIYLSSVFLIIALAQPQKKNIQSEVKKNGVDIVLALDISSSMEMDDFKPNRLIASKKILLDFVDSRHSDRFSLVIFAGEAYTRLPLTFDYNTVEKVIADVNINQITSQDSTAIGDGLAVAVNRLHKSKAKSKVIILITDGENNGGTIDPLTSAQLAKKLGIKIYTIGVGDYNNTLDDELLSNIANTTGGIYFRATDNDELSQVFRKIDSLEKTELNTKVFYNIHEYFTTFIKISLFLLLIGIVFEFLIYIRIP